MDFLELADKFCEPVVSDEALQDKRVDLQMYKDLVMERNTANLCGWVKCPNRVQVSPTEKKVVFCSKECQFMNQQFVASLVEEPPGPIGKIVEKFPDQRPPNPLKRSGADEVEGFKIRVGPHRNALNEIDRWFGGFRVFSFRGMSPEQMDLFTCVNECLKEIGAKLLTSSQDVVQFFCNINVKDPKTVLDAPKPLKMAFSLAIYEYLTQAEVQPALPSFQIEPALYEDLFGIVCKTDEGDY